MAPEIPASALADPGAPTAGPTAEASGPPAPAAGGASLSAPTATAAGGASLSAPTAPAAGGASLSAPTATAARAPESSAGPTAAAAPTRDPEVEDPGKQFRFLLRVPWETITIWVAFLSTIYVLRDFFTMIFMTFIFSYMTRNAVDWVLRKTGRPPGQSLARKGTVLGVFFLELALIIFLGMTVLPRFYDQANAFVKQLRSTDIKLQIESTVEKVVGHDSFQEISKSQWYRDLIADYTKKAGEAIPTITGWITSVLLDVLTMTLQFFLSLVFSLLIVWDIPQLGSKFDALGQSRFGNLYREIAPSLAAFGSVLGRAFQAQAAIAVCNTVLTFAGLFALGIQSPVFLSTIVFVCSFIPVLGVIISSIPISLMALQQSGIGMAIEAIVLILLIHAVEAYILNPKIVGDMMKMHPLLVLVILLLSEHYFKVWGLLLGVPITYYVVRYVIQGEAPKPRNAGAAAPA